MKKLKKLCALALVISFLQLNAIAAEAAAVRAEVSVQKSELQKKDAGIIKLPEIKEIDEKSFQAKMADDEKEYQKIKALAGTEYFFLRDSDGKIRAKFKDNELTEEDQEYKDIKNSWIEGYYIFYKTADRLIRANNLDTQNWRFLIAPKTQEVNAYASSVNLVTINSSMADMFYENEDALAFLIGHELSHHILEHMQIKAKAYERIVKLHNGIINSILFSWLGFPVLFLPPYMIKQRIWYTRARQIETDADLEALILMARAGYDLDYANDVLSSFTQLGEFSKTYKDTHPMNKERIAAVNKRTAELDIDALRLEGRNNLYKKPVLKLKRSSDKKSIVLIPQKSRGAVYYKTVSPQLNIIYKAYESYLKDDLDTAEKLFKEAYSMNKKDYVPCLYLSYINEYKYRKTKDKDALRKASSWAAKAYRKKSADKYTAKQKLDIEMLKF